MDTAYRAALLAQPSEVLGRRLLPFSLGHSYLLEALESPLVNGGDIAEDDIILGAWVCSQAYEASLDAIRSRSTQAECEAWGKAHGLELDWLAIGETLIGHMSSYLTAPERWQSDSTKQAKAPWQLSVATALQMHVNTPEARAWNMPISDALCAYAAIGDLLGDESLMTDSERATLDRLEASSG